MISVRRAQVALPFILLLVAVVAPAAAVASAAETVRVYAAASLVDALERFADRWVRAGHPHPQLVFGSSAALARQVEAGAPADVLLLADPRWMDHVEATGRLQSRADLLGNSLVLVAPRASDVAVELRPGFDLAGAFAGRLCLGEPDSVPAGIYGKEALVALGMWNALRGRIVGTDDVRAALAFVERGACALGVVYATDAARSERARVVARFPAETHRRVVYPVALLRGARPSARAFVDALQGPEAREVFRQYGFTVPAAGSP